jgi:hypothetical protein
MTANNVQGRPFGGMAWIFTKNLRAKIKIDILSDSISILRLENQATFVGVYVNSSNGQGEYDAVLDEITTLIRNYDQIEPLCILGDFNGDLYRTQRGGYWNDNALKRWYEELSETGQLLWASHQYTQRAANTYQLGTRSSTIDHVFLMNSANWARLKQVNIYMSDEESQETLNSSTWHNTNHSDHRPMEIIMSLDDKVVEKMSPNVVVTDNAHKSNKLNWNKPAHVEMYQRELSQIIQTMKFEQRLDEINLVNAAELLETITGDLNEALNRAFKLAFEAVQEKQESKPEYLKRVEKNRNKSWWNEDLDEIHKLKKLYNQKYKESGFELDKLLYNHYRNLGRRMQRRSTKEVRNRKVIELATNFKKNKRKFWAISKQLRNKRREVDIDISELKNIYADTFNKRDKEALGNNETRAVLERRANSIMRKAGSIKVNMETIQNIIQGLKNNKLGGISGVTNELIKYGEYLLTPIIAKLIEKCINYRGTPRCLNIGLLFPILKDDKESNKSTANIRPITLSDALAIIYEKYMLLIIESQYTDHELQFGFRRDYSTNHAIFTLRETILAYRAKNKPVYACFLDFSKAFDKINRAILLRKLSEFMDDDHWLSLFQYYSNSAIIVTNKGQKTDLIETTLGCKQGGPMSPKLFSIYVNSMIEKIAEDSNLCMIGNEKTGFLLYADDTTILCPSLDELQSVIAKVEAFCEEHDITINAKKTKCMIFGSKAQNNNAQKVKINDVELEYVNKFKYLGYWIKSNMCCDEHVKNRKVITMAAAYKLKALGFNTGLLSAELKSFLLSVYCRSTLQYGIENSYMNERLYKELTTAEGNIIKRALGLTKYHSTSMIINALEMEPTTTMIKIRKLAFINQLCKNHLTRRIIEQQLQMKSSLATKSYIRELVKITNENIFTLDLNSISKICSRKIKELKAETEKAKSSKEAIAIRYLLDHRTKTNDDLLRKLTHWSEKKATKKA